MGCFKLECEGVLFYLLYNLDVFILLKLVILSVLLCMSLVIGLV